jgi:hypothetical protein
LKKYLETVYDRDYTAKTSAMLLNECCSLYGGKPGATTLRSAR